MERVELPWQFFALVEGDVQRRFEALRPLFETFDYASFSLGGRERSALLIRAARKAAPTAVELVAVDHLLGLDEGPVLAYDDPRRAVGKRVRIEDGRIVALRLAGETAARQWLRGLWESGSADAELRRWLLAPLSAPPGNAKVGTDRTLCNCLNVSQSAICAGIEARSRSGRPQAGTRLWHQLRLLRARTQAPAGPPAGTRTSLIPTKTRITP